MNRSRRLRCPARPRATGTSKIPDEVVKNIVSLLENFGELPIHVIASFYRYEYNETLDASKINGGLPGLFRALPHLFVTRKDQDGFSMISYEWAGTPEPVDELVLGNGENLAPNLDALRFELVKQIRKKRYVNRIVNQLMDPSGFLWLGKPWSKFLNNGNVIIAKSHYEQAKKIHPNFESEISRIRDFLRRFPEGRRFSDINGRVFNVKVRLFNCSFLSEIIDHFPEVFFVSRTKDDGLLVFDGSRETIADLTGRNDDYFEGGPTPEEIAARAVDMGLYQKTLLLINSANMAGLKINVWFESMILNFYKTDDDKRVFEDENNIHGYDILKFFLALARFDMIVLKSDKEFQNDIRAFMPKRFITSGYLRRTIPGLDSACSSCTNSENNE